MVNLNGDAFTNKYVWALWMTLAWVPLNSANAWADFFSYTIERDAGPRAPFTADEVQVAQAIPESGNTSSDDGTSLPDFESRFAYGRYQFGLTLGYGFSINLPPVVAISGERTKIQAVHFFPNFKYNLTGLMGKSVFRGALYWVVEVGAVVTVDDPRRNGQTVDQAPTFMISLVPAQLEYKFLNPGRSWAPFVFAGVGAAWGDFFQGSEEISTAFEFVLQGGAGIEYFFANGTALNFNYRLWHMSNSGIKGRNVGTNAHVFSLGYNF